MLRRPPPRLPPPSYTRRLLPDLVLPRLRPSFPSISVSRVNRERSGAAISDPIRTDWPFLKKGKERRKEERQGRKEKGETRKEATGRSGKMRKGERRTKKKIVGDENDGGRMRKRCRRETTTGDEGKRKWLEVKGEEKTKSIR